MKTKTPTRRIDFSRSVRKTYRFFSEQQIGNWEIKRYVSDAMIEKCGPRNWISSCANSFLNLLFAFSFWQRQTTFVAEKN